MRADVGVSGATRAANMQPAAAAAALPCMRVCTRRLRTCCRDKRLRAVHVALQCLSAEALQCTKMQLHPSAAVVCVKTSPGLSQARHAAARGARAAA
ncbi:hypothetical protein EON66_05150 [archaeon]|nr:MAG: hypothetical protein EON66_05150 [archaeon]